MSNVKKPIIDPRMCAKHRMWLKKGKCEICRLEERRAQLKQEQLTGSNKPEVKIGKM